MRDVIERTLEVVVGRELEEEKDSVFVAARGAALVGFFLALVEASLKNPLMAGLSVAASLLAAWFATKAPPRATRLRTHSTKVRITPDTIEHGAEIVRRADIATAAFHPGPQPSVRCSDPLGKILFEAVVKDEAEGSEVLEALGGNPGRMRTSFVIAGPFGTTPLRRLGMMAGGYALAIAALFTMPKVVSGGWFVLVAMALLVLPRVMMSAPGRFEVGADGVVLRWWGTKRYLPYGVIERVERAGAYVRIVRRGASDILVNPVADAAGLDGLVARIEGARRARGQLGARVELESRLARGGRTVAAWREDLSRIEEHDGYRDAALSRQDLWRIVEDASAPEDARVAAAIVLRRIDDAPRLRVAADTVASPKLRVALELLAEPELEDEELERRLASVTTTK